MDFKERAIAPNVTIADHVGFMTEPLKILIYDKIPVYFLRGGDREIVRVEVVFPFGSYHQQKPLQAFTAANMLKNGTIKKSSSEINKAWDFMGSSLQVDAQKDLITVGFYCLAKYLPTALDLLTEMLTEPSYPEDELELFLKNRKQIFLVDLKKVSYVARAQFAGLLYGYNHPYGTFLKSEDFDNLQREDVLAFYNRFLQLSNCMIFISGNFPDNTGQLIKNKFKSIHLSNHANNNGFNIQEIKPMKGKHLISKENASQSSVRIGKIAINRKHPDFHKLSLTNTLLGGYFGSRLMQNIRQNKGFTYGIHSGLVTLVHSSYFFITSQIGKKVVDQAIPEIYQELNKLRTQPVSDEEILMLRNYLAGSFLRMFDGPFAQIQRWKEILIFGQQPSYYTDFLKTLKSIKSDDFQNIAERYLHEEQMTELVVG
ncbi:MAG: M16 family metallopeptidase [Bacteroidota bacterium]